MYPLAHFAIGVIGGLILLYLFPKLIGSKLKNDILFLFGSGIFATLPDLPFLWGAVNVDNLAIMNIFWLHAFFDQAKYETNTFMVGTVLVAGVLLYMYWKRL